MTKNKIGIFGGSFNPVHKAHVAAAELFIEKAELDLLYVIPNGIPPLKEPHSVSGKDRFEMLKIAFSGKDKVIISDVELKRAGVSYTCDTIAELKKMHPESEFFLLVGDDWIGSFDRWRNYRYILENATLAVAYRGDADINADVEKLEKLCGRPPMVLGNQRIEMSSAKFRAERRREFLPDGVYEYIKKQGLYGL